MSRIFKSNYVKVGAPKPIKSNFPIIKKEEPPIAMTVEAGLSPDEVANNIIKDAKEMYLRIIEEANRDAQKIIEDANQERNSIYSKASEQGYTEGYQAGYKDGENLAESIIQQAVDIKSDLDQRRSLIYMEAEHELMELVLDIANKVLNIELTQNKEVMMSLINQALQKCAFRDKLTIRVSDQDFDFVNASKDRIIRLAEGINDLEIQLDKALEKGSCIIETPSGEINASINVQMREIQKAFEYLLRNE